MERVRADERLDPKVAILFFKDLGAEYCEEARVLEDLGYHPLAMEANMVLSISPLWKDLGGYVFALNAKARTWLRSIMARSATVRIRDLSAREITNSIPRFATAIRQCAGAVTLPVRALVRGGSCRMERTTGRRLPVPQVLRPRPTRWL